MTRLQRRRALFQWGFFALFLLAPPLDLFRIDLYRGHAIFLGMDWQLGIDAFIRGETDIFGVSLSLLLFGFIPLFGGGALFLWSAWRFGRLYCGWLCPHFSVVEIINRLMLRASGKPSLWESKTLPKRQPNGRSIEPNPLYWILVAVAVLGFSFLWALAFLTYLLPPFEIYHNLLTAQLTRNQTIFLTAATLALSIEFTFARHLFCRFACAVGHFQSLSWMANKRAMVVGFDTQRARDCHSCNNACDNVCPMRLKPRTVKRKMFTCTECAQCISACEEVQQGKPGLLRWVEGADALPVISGRGYPKSTETDPDSATTEAEQDAWKNR